METGRFTAAIRLEELWNALLSARDFELFCAYPIDVLSGDFQTAEVDAVMCAHTNVVASTASLERALDRAIGDVLGTNAAALQSLMSKHYWPAWATLPRAEAMIPVGAQQRAGPRRRHTGAGARVLPTSPRNAALTGASA